ncbi:hypothetical protein K470DRAFT_213184 [Piedraia hortae CBS 480.64]|uniref:DUF3074 domain-containing protein n=1 Tax=Piedraia hortae CBS 480.64 TaxID=1314780 RepID=A0A6A7C412_9PEZI|nr:hypothetical protein K470DRAFT_213184 [Piedraia hortae CBS 480.64]
MIRLLTIPASALPAHHDLASSSQQPDAFAELLLHEAEEFMKDFVSSKFRLVGSRQSPPADATVELGTYERGGDGVPREIWFACTSVHVNSAASGTASWDEFNAGLRENHSRHEMQYTPNVTDAHEVLVWDSQLLSQSIGDWDQIDMRIMEMMHRLPPPLSRRVFPVLVLTATRREGNAFLVVQIPVDVKHLPQAKHTKSPNTVTAMYTSVERGELIDNGARVRWQMATASDAKGNLPMSIQKMGVPGAIVKDVGLFIDWVSKQRHQMH